ncbi:MAG: hypothetical protein RLZZ339_2316 [Cyanobacteriota bacterium]|jgi:hypothetical protein|uniref:Uncharacterized protein n=1 Tax=Microcystis aeruginosa NIES-44 TaxID=449439 RepID=A0A0A1VSB7_MICAE|nr:hypothetical protein N44_00886 [Microcystis aeruginosa NIES-44]
MTGGFEVNLSALRAEVTLKAIDSAKTRKDLILINAAL